MNETLTLFVSYWITVVIGKQQEIHKLLERSLFAYVARKERRYHV
jgi:hypothetical protein